MFLIHDCDKNATETKKKSNKSNELLTKCQFIMVRYVYYKLKKDRKMTVYVKKEKNATLERWCRQSYERYD